MAYDEQLADKIRVLLTGTKGLTEKKMFGGIGWMIGGNMAVGAHSDGRLMVRCAKDDFEAFSGEKGAQGMIHGGRLMTGFVLVDADAVKANKPLEKWVDRGRDYAASLPPKPAKKK